jgi:transposase
LESFHILPPVFLDTDLRYNTLNVFKEIFMTEHASQTAKRWSAKRKADVVLRLIRGEDIDEVSRAVGVATHRLHEWREEALLNLEDGFKQRVNDPKDAQLSRAKEQIGELSMEVELLKAKIAKKGPLVSRRSKR